MTVPSGMPPSKCPNCFIVLDPWAWAFRCGSGLCAEEPDDTLTAFTGVDSRSRPVTPVTPNGEWRPDQGTSCGKCRKPAQQEVCTRCHYELLPGWRLNTTTCIALAGARTSGKSIYTAVLVKQLELWCEQHGQPFQAADARTSSTYKRLYETPLFEQRKLMAATPSAQVREAPHRDPLVFSIGRYNGVPHLLVIRDVAGEDLENPGTPLAPFRFFALADLVTFMFDPLRLPEIRAQLAGVVQETSMTGADPSAVLTNLIRLIRGGASVGGGQLPTPFALVVAKFDVLADLAEVEGSPLSHIMDNRGAAYNLDPSLEQGVDEDDQQRLEAEVESLLIKLNARNLLNMVQNLFVTHRTFAVSALGDHPFSAQSTNARGIAPFRVLDPVRWALARSGAIPWTAGQSTSTPS